MTSNQIHALRLLNIQEDKRGFVRECVMDQCGITRPTLLSLARHGLAELKTTGKRGPDPNHGWRITVPGMALANHLMPLDQST